MSSCGNPAIENDALMTRRIKFDRSKGCIKCKTSTGNIVIRHAVYCKECFFPLVNTKFRKSLQPSINEQPDGPRQKALRASGNLLVGFSGGLGSTVLIDLIAKNYFMKSQSSKGGNHHPRKLNEKVWSKGYICYVEACNAFPDLRNRVEEIRAVVDKYEAFDFVPLYLEDAFDLTWWEKVGGPSTGSMLGLDLGTEGGMDNLLISYISSSTYPDPISRLRAYLSAMPTQTALLSSVQTLIRVLLLHTSAYTTSSHLLLGTSLTSLSISLISGIAQGSGFAVREEIQEEWSSDVVKVEAGRLAQIRIVRPLRDVVTKECSAWAWWNGLTVVGRESIPHAKLGIGSLTKEFILGLETDYPSTVSTIARTCAKLAPKGKHTGVCALCQRPTPFDVLQWKSRISILSYSDSSLLHDSLAPHLCYACHTMLTGRSSRGIVAAPKKDDTETLPTPLPLWVQISNMAHEYTHDDHPTTPDAYDSEVIIARPMAVKEMEAQIGSYLLDDE